MEKQKNYKGLKVWQKGIEIVEMSYLLTLKFPKQETYGLTSQIRRSAISLPSNIAEGFKRFSRKDFRHFLSIAMGSAAELETQFIIAEKLQYIDLTEKEDLCELIDHFSRMMTKLMQSLNTN